MREKDRNLQPIRCGCESGKAKARSGELTGESMVEAGREGPDGRVREPLAAEPPPCSQHRSRRMAGQELGPGGAQVSGNVTRRPEPSLSTRPLQYGPDSSGNNRALGLPGKQLGSKQSCCKFTLAASAKDALGG